MPNKFFLIGSRSGQVAKNFANHFRDGPIVGVLGCFGITTVLGPFLLFHTFSYEAKLQHNFAHLCQTSI